MVAGLLLQFLLSHGMLLFNEIILGELLNLVLQNLVSKKLETSVYRMVQSIFRYHKPLRRDSRVWQREGQTDRQTDFATTNAAPHSRDQQCGPRSMVATGYAHAKRQNRTGSLAHSITPLTRSLTGDKWHCTISKVATNWLRLTNAGERDTP